MSASPNFPKELDEIKDPIDRALLREKFKLERELAHVRALLDDTPWIERFALQEEMTQWIEEHKQDPTKSQLQKFDEFERRAKPIERRLNRQIRLDSIALMDHGFDLRRQIQEIDYQRADYAFHKRIKIADDAIVGKFRAAIKLEEIRMTALSRHFAKAKAVA